jgi:hypothetical protein
MDNAIRIPYVVLLFGRLDALTWYQQHMHTTDATLLPPVEDECCN